jgi:hypothetical protein
MNPFKSLSEETRNKLWFLSLILFFPITGIILLVKANKGCDFETFIDEWSVYLLLLGGWMLIAALIGFTILGIIYNLVETLIVIGVILGILFLFLGIPYIVYRIANLK